MKKETGNGIDCAVDFLTSGASGFSFWSHLSRTLLTNELSFTVLTNLSIVNGEDTLDLIFSYASKK